MKKELTDKQRESMRAASRKYYHKNVDRFNAYRAANRGIYNESNKKQRAKLKNDFYTVYFIPEANYVGYTQIPVSRMVAHKHLGKDVTNWQVIDTFETKREALDTERMLQEVYKFNGKNDNYDTKY